MKTVIDNINELIIKKSKFITFVYNVSTRDQATEKINNIKNEYKDATHVCYAYIINNQEKYDDNGEPSGTAGMPILNILKKENLDNVLCIVVRYFGGIKLGAGGLVRTYAKACKEAIITKSLEKGYKIKISFDYNDIKQVDYLLKDSIIEDKQYNIKTEYIFLIKIDEYEKIITSLKQISNIEMIEEIFI